MTGYVKGCLQIDECHIKFFILFLILPLPLLISTRIAEAGRFSPKIFGAYFIIIIIIIIIIYFCVC